MFWCCIYIVFNIDSMSPILFWSCIYIVFIIDGNLGTWIRRSCTTDNLFLTLTWPSPIRKWGWKGRLRARQTSKKSWTQSSLTTWVNKVKTILISTLICFLFLAWIRRPVLSSCFRRRFEPGQQWRILWFGVTLFSAKRCCNTLRGPCFQHVFYVELYKDFFGRCCFQGLFCLVCCIQHIFILKWYRQSYTLIKCNTKAT